MATAAATSINFQVCGGNAATHFSSLMNQTTTFDIEFQNKVFCFDKLHGCLLCGDRDNNGKQSIMQNESHLHNVLNPFLLHPTLYAPLPPTSHKRLLTLYAKFLTWLCRHCYPIAYWISKVVSLNAFANAQQAILFYRNIYPSAEEQRRLCLPRAIFAATTSCKFKKNGVMYIGAFLPSTQMHAWVIEDNQQPDMWDNEWICYKPVYMLYHQ